MIPVIYNVRSLAVRKATTIASAVGIGLVVFVLASALMLSNGLQKTLGTTGDPKNAIVIRKGSDAELSSGIEDAQVGLIMSAPGVVKDNQGQPLGVKEIVAVIALDKEGATGISNVQVRGVPDNVMAFRPNVKLVSGRPHQPGTDEAIIGKRLVGRFKGLDLGGSFELKKNRPLKVVGVFEDAGSSFESEVWAGVDTVRTSFGREGVVSSVRVRLESETKFDAFEAAIEQDKQLGLEAQRERAYYETQSEGSSAFISILGIVITVFFSIGAIIGAMITMYATVANRQREIGTLRALGFSRSKVLFSFLLEALMLSLLGGGVGILASLGMGVVKFSMINFASWSEIIFTFDPTPGILLFSLGVGGIMGLLGGLAPAIRAARISPIEAMRG
jgi:putative ABC transport system permease protein